MIPEKGRSRQARQQIGEGGAGGKILNPEADAIDK